MPKIFKLNPATYISFAYLWLIFWVWLEINLPDTGAQGGIAMIFLTLPWIMLFTLTDNYLPRPYFDYLFPYFIFLSAFLNAAVIHLFGVVMIWSVKKTENPPANTGDSDRNNSELR